MTIKDKLASLRAKATRGEKDAMQCLYPLIYDVKLISIKSLTKYEVSIFQTRVRSLSWWPCRRR